jgi:hypothetical protein
MSGGHFNYDQYHIRNVIDALESHLNGTEPFYTEYSQETLDEFKKGLVALKKAYVYVHRIDYLLSADDGESTFHERLKEELDAIR